MARIEIIPADWETSEEKKQGNGTPTIDVCHSCRHYFEEGEPIDFGTLSDLAARGTTFDTSDKVGSIEVEHPPYSDAEYTCDVCGADLTDEDD